ncbi:MAG: hypothetical protein MJ128_06790 [Mogibacterium sp.]|nr:hypothetical protein [Mogibacterium sp.]
MKSFNLQRYYDEAARIGENASDQIAKLRSNKAREIAIVLQDGYADLFNRLTDDVEDFITECPNIRIVRNAEGVSIYTYRR